MLTDFRTMPDGTEIAADICIVGAGAAGITIAKALIDAPLQICLLESGGLEFEEEIQHLYDGETTGQPWYDEYEQEHGVKTELSELVTSRLRYFGGTTNAWGGGCAYLDNIDFRARPWVPHSGWPITKQDLAPYYERARPFLQVGKTDWDPSEGDQLTHAPRFDSDKFVNRYWFASGVSRPGEDQPKPTPFGTVYGPDLERAANIRVLLHASLLEFEVNHAATAVLGAHFRTLEGKHGNVRARAFVLACGGIENARLLLLSNSVAKAGLGNDHDLVGRFFMDHPTGISGFVTTTDPNPLTVPYTRHVAKNDLQISAALCLGEAAQERNRILNARVCPTDFEEGPIPDGIVAARKLRAANHETFIPSDLGETVWRIGKDLGDVIPATYRHLVGRPVILKHSTDLVCFYEQAPNPESRITLSDRLDRFGQHKVHLDWRLTALDRLTYRTVPLLFGAELARLNYGRLRLASWVSAEGPDVQLLVGGRHHHFGTTRMSDDPRRGVVDRNCRIHGVANCYVAGSSCFPTSGQALPTFTIVALAIRLADHLRSHLV